MNEIALIARQPSGLSFTFTPDALLLKEAALDSGALVGHVTNAEQNAVAVHAQREIKRVMALFEKERKAAKEPLLEAGRALDRAVTAEMVDLEKEFGRISNAVSAFQLAEARRLAEEQRLQQAELARIEAEKQAALAAATTVEQKTAIEEVAAAKVYVESRPVVATRSEGQIVKTDWEITVTNPYELAKYHPDCVTITARLTEIKAALNAGQTIKGIKAEKVTKSSVRLAPERKAIEV